MVKYMGISKKNNAQKREHNLLKPRPKAPFESLRERKEGGKGEGGEGKGGREGEDRERNV